VAVSDRIGRAEGRVGPAPCAHPAPCRISVTTEIVLLPGGREEIIGEAPPPLCEVCPEREERNRPVRWVEVVRDLRNRHGGRDHEEATSAATLPAARFDGAREGHGSPGQADAPMAPESKGNILPAAWGSEHPARLAALGLEPPDRPRGRGDRETPRIDPRDFGL